MKKLLSSAFNVVLAVTLVFGLTPGSALASTAQNYSVQSSAQAGDGLSDTDFGPKISVALADAGGDSESNAAASDESSTVDEPELLYAEANGFDYFTVDVADDGISAAQADGETASSAVQSLCNKIYAGYDELATEVIINDGTTVGDFQNAMNLITANPEYYWAATTWRFSYYDNDGTAGVSSGDTLYSVYLYYCVDTNDIDTVKANMEAKIAEALSWVDFDNMTQFEAVQALHDYLVRNCAYDTTLANGAEPNETTIYGAYGALVNGSCVCQGYALAYKLLLKRAGLTAVLVMSDSMNHAWNMVQMDDGGWYHVDTTWDDPVYTASDGTYSDGGFDADVSHTYFLRADSTMKNSLSHYGWEAAYTTPSSDYANRTYATYNGPVVSIGSSSGSDSTGGDDASPARTVSYSHSDSKTSNGVTINVEWDDPELGQPTTFHVSATGGTGVYKFYLAAPAYSSTGSAPYTSVPNPSCAAYAKYTDECTSYDFTFTMTATGTYYYNFYVMYKASADADAYTTLRTNTFISVADDAYPSVNSIVSDTVAKAKAATDGSEYQMALWLHDWLIDQMSYDKSLTWASTEAALTRHTGTCQAYTDAYADLLKAAGITCEETRDINDGHTWNAVQIDGQWCQIDCTWDDVDISTDYGFDAKHLYFGLTDELMLLAHQGWSASSGSTYGTHETALSNNYFVRNGNAAEWASAYKDRIQTQIDAKATSFAIDSDNASLPPSICGIQNGIVAYAINQLQWAASDGINAVLVAASNVQTQSSDSWTAEYDFTVTYGGAASDSGAGSGSDSGTDSGTTSDGGTGSGATDSDSGTDPTPSLTKIGKPTGATLVYNGSKQTGVSAGTGYTLSGTAKATNAGTYTAYAKLKSGYVWSDGSTGDVKINWTISRAAVVAPEAKTGLVYNKQKQTGVQAGSGYALSGTTKAKKAGTYTATATLDDNHIWSDGTTDAKTITWYIQPVKSATYSLASSLGKKFRIAVAGNSKKNGANVQLAVKKSAKSQQWTLTFDSESGTYIVKNAKSGKVLSVSGSAKKGANVVQQKDSGKSTQRWIIEKTSSGYVLRSAAKKSLALTVAGGKATSGANLKLARVSADSKSQAFALKTV